MVAITSGLGGIAYGILIMSSRQGWQVQLSLVSMALGLVLGIVSYYVVAYLVFRVGTELFGSRTKFKPVRRSLAYSYAPALLGVIPCLGVLGLSNTRTMWTIILSWVVWLTSLSTIALVGVAAVRIARG